MNIFLKTIPLLIGVVLITLGYSVYDTFFQETDSVAIKTLHKTEKPEQGKPKAIVPTMTEKGSNAPPPISDSDNKQGDNTQEKVVDQALAVKLNIKVFNVFPSADAKSGYALISSNDKPQQVYIVGAELEEDVYLKKVSTGEILINNHGKDEKYFPVKPPASISAPKFSTKTNNDDPNYEPGLLINAPPPPVLPVPLPGAGEKAQEYIPPPPNDTSVTPGS